MAVSKSVCTNTSYGGTVIYYTGTLYEIMGSLAADKIPASNVISIYYDSTAATHILVARK